MKVALVYELLTMKGGAERVAKIFTELFPEAPIFTLLYDEKKLGDWFPRERIRTSSIQKLAHRYPLPANRYNHHLYLSRFPAAVEAWDFSEFDLVLSSSSAFVHGIITNGKPKHLCYVHSPARYLWDRTHDVLDRAGKSILGPLKHSYLSRTFHQLREWDSEVAPRPDRLLAASKEVQRRIELYWQRESPVLTPPIDDIWLANEEPVMVSPSNHDSDPRRPSPIRQAQGDVLTTPPYYLIVSTLAPYKQIDYVVEACTQGNLPLVIAGDGPDRERLQRLAGPTITFLGHQEAEQLRTLYSNASATIFPGNEDFGLVPLESLATGTPVIAWRGGGALETLKEGVTGAFFSEQTAENLLNTIRNFDHKKYSKEICITAASKHSKSQFVQGLYSNIDSLMKNVL